VESAAYHFALAKLHASDGEFEQAETQYRRALGLDTASVVLHVDFAQFLASLRRLDEAKIQAQRALELDGENADALRTLGQIHWSLGRSDPQELLAARDALERLRLVSPEDLQGLVGLGQIYEQTGDIDKAIEVYRDLVSRNTDNSQLKRLLVDALSRAGRSDEARTELQEMMRIEQESTESRMALAELEAEKGNHTEAIRLIEEGDERLRSLAPVRAFLAEQYLRHASAPGLSKEQRTEDLEAALAAVRSLPDDEKDPGLFRLEGMVLRRLGRVDEAVALFRALVEERPSEPWSHLLLSGLLEAMQRLEEASQVLEGALERFAGQPSVRLDLVGRLLWLDSQRSAWPRVLLWSDQLLASLDGKSREAVIELRAEALGELGRYDEALKLVRSEARREGASPTHSLLEARVLAAAERPKEALKVLSSSVLAKSTDPATVLQAARLLAQLGEEDEAARRVQEFAAADTLSARFTAGQYFSAAGRFSDAMPHLRRALELSRIEEREEVRADAHFWLGQALERTGEVEDAAREFREVLKLRPDDTTTMNYLGYMWAEAGVELDAALQLVQRAVQIEPDNGSYVDSLGWALFRLGRFEEARDALEKAAQLSPGNAVILEHLGDVYRATGEIESAIEHYRQAAEIEDPENLASVTEKLDELRSSQRP
jgi:tetratricopeptide (TPR) repeat protein